MSQYHKHGLQFIYLHCWKTSTSVSSEIFNNIQI